MAAHQRQPVELEEFFLTTAELAQRWRVSVGAMHNLRHKGLGLPYVKTPSGQVLYRASDILDAEQRGTKGVTPHNVGRIILDYPDLDERSRKKLAAWVVERLGAK